MTTSRQHRYIAVDLTTSADPREREPGERADPTIVRAAHDLTGSVVEFLGLKANNPKVTPYDYTEAVLYLLAVALFAAAVGIVVGVATTVLLGAGAGGLTSVAGALFVGLTRQRRTEDIRQRRSGDR